MAPAPLPLPIRLGETLAGKYRIESVLGRGGMGVVLAATHLRLEQRVAIEFLVEGASVPEMRARFAREARAASKIRSEHVVRILDVGTLDSGAPYTVMEYLAGLDLERTLRTRGALPVAEAVGYVLQACEALAEAHVAGIVHRDVKPANVFLARRADGSVTVKLLDFGISKIAASGEGAITNAASVLGSPMYMPPEQIRSARNVDARGDLWSLGALLFELVTGRPPFRAETLPELCVQILEASPPALEPFLPNGPPGLSAVIQRCLTKSLAGRFQTVSEVATALEPFGPPAGRVSVERVARITDRGAPGAVPGAAPPEGQGPDEAQPPRSGDTVVVAEGFSELAQGGAPGTTPTSPVSPYASTTKPSVRRPKQGLWVALTLTTGVALFVALRVASRRAPVAIAGNAGGGEALLTGSCETVDSSDFYVSPTGRDRCSFVSITSAVRAATRSRAASKTVHVTRGIYAQHTSGEVFPIELRGDVSLVGEGADKTILEGLGEVSHRLAGGAISDDALQATLVTGDAEGTTRIAGLAIESGEKGPKFHAFGVFCDRGRARLPREPASAPNLLVEDVAFGSAYDTGLVLTSTLVPVASGCSARVTASQFEGSWYGVFALGCGAGVGEIPVDLVLGGEDAASGSIFRGHRHEGDGAGVILWGCVAHAAIRHATFTDGDVGIQLDQRLPPPSFGPYATSIEDDSFSGLAEAGLRMWRAPVVGLLARNRFERIAGAAIELDDHGSPGSPSIARARANQIVGNGAAVRVDGHHPLATPSDFGTSVDPGGNLLACNAGGHALVQSVAGELRFAGNAWDHGSPSMRSLVPGVDAGSAGDVLAPEGSWPDVSSGRLAEVSCPHP